MDAREEFLASAGISEFCRRTPIWFLVLPTAVPLTVFLFAFVANRVNSTWKYLVAKFAIGLGIMLTAASLAHKSLISTNSAIYFPNAFFVSIDGPSFMMFLVWLGLDLMFAWAPSAS